MGKSTIQLVDEEASVSKRLVHGDTVVVALHTTSRDQPVEVTEIKEKVSIETVEIGREISEIPQIRTEGDVTIIPIVQEEIVILKRLILKQEVRLTKTRTEEKNIHSVALQSEYAIIERNTPPAIDSMETAND